MLLFFALHLKVVVTPPWQELISLMADYENYFSLFSFSLRDARINILIESRVVIKEKDERRGEKALDIFA